MSRGLQVVIKISFKNNWTFWLQEDPLELDNLTMEYSGGKTPGYQDFPPDYQAVVMNSPQDDSDCLPDYEDDVVEKVMV